MPKSKYKKFYKERSRNASYEEIKADLNGKWDWRIILSRARKDNMAFFIEHYNRRVNKGLDKAGFDW